MRFRVNDRIAVLKTVQRVLTATAEHRPPDPADVADLQEYAHSCVEKDPDELACDAIRTAIDNRRLAQTEKGETK